MPFPEFSLLSNISTFQHFPKCVTTVNPLTPPVKPSLLMVQRAVIPIILPKLKNQDKNVCFLKPLSYRVNCTAMITDTLPLSIPSSLS